MMFLSPSMMKIGGAILAVGAILGGVWLYGNSRYNQGQSDLAAKIASARAESVEEAERIENEVEELDTDELLDAVLGYVRRP